MSVRGLTFDSPPAQERPLRCPLDRFAAALAAGETVSTAAWHAGFAHADGEQLLERLEAELGVGGC